MPDGSTSELAQLGQQVIDVANRQIEPQTRHISKQAFEILVAAGESLIAAAEERLAEEAKSGGGSRKALVFGCTAAGLGAAVWGLSKVPAVRSRLRSAGPGAEVNGSTVGEEGDAGLGDDEAPVED